MSKEAPESHILVNKWSTPDGTVLISRHRHDYVDYTDKNGNYHFIDGGTEYIRTSGNLKNECIYTDNPFEVIREYFVWKSYGVNGDVYEGILTKLKDLSEDHINAILMTQVHLPEYIKEVFRNELEYRLNEE